MEYEKTVIAYKDTEEAYVVDDKAPKDRIKDKSFSLKTLDNLVFNMPAVCH